MLVSLQYCPTWLQYIEPYYVVIIFENAQMLYRWPSCIFRYFWEFYFCKHFAKETLIDIKSWQLKCAEIHVLCYIMSSSDSVKFYNFRIFPKIYRHLKKCFLWKYWRMWYLFFFMISSLQRNKEEIMLRGIIFVRQILYLSSIRNENISSWNAVMSILCAWDLYNLVYYREQDFANQSVILYIM